MRSLKRVWLVRWIYLTIVVHLLVGIALPVLAHSPLLNNYHQHIEAFFWHGTAPAAARQQQIWWISLFGPTVQAGAIWMGALARIADIQRSAFAWASLLIGILVWAPQDIIISLQANYWPHVWLDLFAVVTMVSPLIGLWIIDFKASKERA